MKLIAIILFCIVFASCENNNSLGSSALMSAYVPVYAQPGETDQITVETVKPTVNAGKIYSYGAYIFQNENNKGFHIINNSNPASPVKIAFLKVPFSTEIAIRNGFMYTNNVNDLVVFNLTNPQSPVLVKRVKDAFPAIQQSYPPISNVYFECADPAKGIVVAWELKNIPMPKCRG